MCVTIHASYQKRSLGMFSALDAQCVEFALL